MHPALVAVSHGTADAGGIAAVAGLVRAIGDRLPATRVVAAQVDVLPPDPLAAMATLPDGPRVIVPLLLSTGYHVRVDLAEAAEAGGATVAPALGPDPRIAVVLERRLREAGLAAGERVVLVAAGSSDPDAADACRAQAAMLAARLGRAVDTAFLTAAEPRAAAVVSPDTAVASYLLAPGVFQSKAEALPAARVSRPLLLPDDTPAELVDVAVDRFGVEPSGRPPRPAGDRIADTVDVSGRRPG